MPRLDPKKIQPEQIYGVKEVENNLSMRERMAKRFRAHDTVQVLNVDDESVQWQWLNEDDETYTITDENIKIVKRGMPGLWQLDSSEKDILEGACAYVMLETLFKRMCVKKVGVNEHPLDEREIKNFSFDDPESQEHFLDRAFVGKMSPHAMQQAAVAQLNKNDKPAKTKETSPA